MAGAMLVTSFLLCLTSVGANMFPSACLPNLGKDTKFPTTCCPPYEGVACGAHLNRGSCLPVMKSRSLPPPDVHLDYSDNFPEKYFNVTCTCKGRFWGPNCGECQFGYRGRYCNESYTVIRREIRSLSKAERTRFFADLSYCKCATDPDYLIMTAGDRFRISSYRFQHASFYDTWSYIHHMATKPFINNTRETFANSFAHGSTGFMGWHRYFLALLERTMQRCMNDDTWALCLYDWRDDTECTICNNDFLGASDSQGRIDPMSCFSRWRTVCGEYGFDETNCLMPDCECERSRLVRRPGYQMYTYLPSRADIESCLKIPNYDTYPYSSSSRDSARNCFEGFHNMVHMFMGGTMSMVPLSSNDPIFFLHHCTVDMFLELYINRWSVTPADYPPNQKYGHQGSSCMEPLWECRRQMDMLVPSTEFGYEYDQY